MRKPTLTWISNDTKASSNVDNAKINTGEMKSRQSGVVLKPKPAELARSEVNGFISDLNSKANARNGIKVSPAPPSTVEKFMAGLDAKADNKTVVTLPDPIRLTADSFYTLPFPTITLIVGMTGSGKTTLVKRLVKTAAKQQQFHRVVALCPTNSLQGNVYRFLPKEYVKTNVTEELLEGILQQQEQGNSDGRILKTLLILDDCISYIGFKSNLWNRIASMLRHFNMSLFLVLQNISSSIPPILKENATTMFCTKLKMNSLKTIFGMQTKFGKESDFNEWFATAVKDWGAVRVELTSKEPALVAMKQPPFTKAEDYVLQFG